MILETHNLTIGYHDQLLIKEVELSINPGEIVYIFSDNGLGKSSLLKTMLGLIPKLNGNVNCPSIDLVSWVPTEHLGFFPHLTGIQNLELFNIQAEKIQQLKRVHNDFLNKILTEKVQNFSSGMKQVLKIIVSIYSEKLVLVWDEPFRSLSENNIQLLIDLILKELEGRVLIFTGHSTLLAFDSELLKVKKYKIDDQKLKQIK